MTPALSAMSADEARRVALAAQGVGALRPTGASPSRPGMSQVRRVLAHVGVIQIDSVNVLVRSQELPLFARLGPHPRDLLPKLLARQELFEYWAHEASLVPVELHPLLRWRMEDATRGHAWKGIVRLARERPGFVEGVYEEVRDRGPLFASELTDPGKKRTDHWGWNWNHGKIALEYLFWCGRITARRTASSFERQYAVPSVVIPQAVLELPTPTREDAQRGLVERAARSLGISTAADIADYFRLRRADVVRCAAELLEEGVLRPVQVEGWRDVAYLHRDAKIPRRFHATALLSPFDSVCWFRPRAERLFGFHYRIEIYTPAAKRVYGYYVLPVLWGDTLVARVDLKADRAASVLRVHGAFAEIGVPVGAIVSDLVGELRAMASWLALDNVTVGDRGDLAPLLAKQLNPRRRASTTPTAGRATAPARPRTSPSKAPRREDR